MFKDKLQVSREKFEFWYSLVILLIIPVLITANTLLLITGLRKNFDIELRRKAEAIAHVIEVSIYKDLNKPSALETSIQRITSNRSDIAGITILQKYNDELRVVGSSDNSLVGNTTSDLQLVFAIERNQAVAQLVKNKDGMRIWKIASPIHDDKNKVIGVQTIDVSLQDADTLISDLLLRSLVVLAASIVIVILLLFNHFRFVEYAMLFKKLKELDQLKDDFLSVATHELKAPMTVIKGNIENISDGLMGPVDEKVKDALATMYQETERLNGLVSDLLNVSRIEQGRVTYTIESVDLSESIDRIVSQFSNRAHTKGLGLSYQKPNEQLFVFADAGRITEILTNLVDNAIKYSREGSVSIAHVVTKDMVKTIVQDTGIGISPQDRERLFNRFYRVKSEATKDIGGTGLGLWIIKQYVEYMKGKIYVDSMEGAGSKFIVELPRAYPSAVSSQEDSVSAKTEDRDEHQQTQK